MCRTDARLWHAAVSRGIASKPWTLPSIHFRKLPRRDSAVAMLELFIIISVSVKRLLRAMWRVCRSISGSQKQEKHFSKWNPNSASTLNAFCRYWEKPLANYTPQFLVCTYGNAVGHPFLTVSSLDKTVHHLLNRETADKTVQQSTLKPIFHLRSFTMTTEQINWLITHTPTVSKKTRVLKHSLKHSLRVKQPRFPIIQFETRPRWAMKCHNPLTHFQDFRFPANLSVQPQSIFLKPSLGIAWTRYHGPPVTVPSKHKHLLHLGLRSRNYRVDLCTCWWKKATVVIKQNFQAILGIIEGKISAGYEEKLCTKRD